MEEQAVQAYSNITTHLTRLRRKESLIRLLSASALSACILLGTGLLLVAAEHLFYLPVLARSTFLTLILTASCFTLVRWGILPLLSPKPLEHYAIKVEDRFPEFKNRLIGTLQLWSKRYENPEGYSRAMIERIAQEADAIAGRVDVSRVIDRRVLFNGGKALAGICIIWLVIIGSSPEAMRKAVIRCLHPSTPFIRPPDVAISVKPGDAEVLKGSDLEIEIQLSGRIPREVTLHYAYGTLERASDIGSQSETENTKGWNQVKLPTQRKRKDILKYSFKDLYRPILYYVKANRVRSPTFLIKVSEPPMVKHVFVRYRFPPYTMLAPITGEDGNISALVGTEVSMRILSNKRLDGARLLMDDGSVVDCEVRGRSAKAKISVERDLRYHIDLTDTAGNHNLQPVEYRIQALRDEYPRVRIAHPGQDTDLSEDMILPLLIEASDDFGISRLELVYNRTGQTEQGREPISLLGKPLRGVTEEYTWDLSALNLLPEDLVRYHVEVYDNDAISGPKKAVSKEFTVRFPSVREIFEEAQREQRGDITQLEGMLEELDRIKEGLKELRRKLLKGRRPEWEDERQVRSAAEEQMKMIQAIRDIANEVEHTINRLRTKNLLTLETLRKMEQLKELLDRVATPEMKKALERVHKAMKQLDPQQLERAIKEFTFSQEEFQKRLDRTISILKRLQLEQQLDAAVRLSEELVRRQKQLNKAVKKEKETEGLASTQESIQKDTEYLGDSLGKLEEEIPTAQLGSVSDLTTKMGRAASMMRAGEIEPASKVGEEILSDLKILSNRLRDFRDRVMEGQKAQIVREIKDTLRDVMYLSESQEELAKDSGTGRAQTKEVSERQAIILQGTSGVAKDLWQIAQKTFFINEEIGNAVGRALSSMNNAISALENRNRRLASVFQHEALGNLNQTAILLYQAFSNVLSAPSSIGFNELMQKLQGLSDRQKAINDATERLGQGKLSLEEQAMLARLAAEQAIVKRGIEELAEQMGSRRDVLGRIDELGKEVAEVIKDLQREQVNQETIQRQRRILSRLLDAQRSLRRRDYTRRREAEVGGKYFRRGPDGLPEDLGERRNLLEEELKKALQQDYSSEYRELILRYFEAISGDVETSR